MRTIGLITADPEHPLLAATSALLGGAHRVTVLHPEQDPADVPGPLADVYLLKARTSGALALAHSLELRGSVVLNSAEATRLCQDRTAMADTALAAGLPFAPTLAAGPLGRLAAGDGPVATGPVVVKSRYSRKHDLVARVVDGTELRELAAAWPDEPVILQDLAPGTGWDHKLWAVGDTYFAALRRSELSPGGRGPTLSLALADLPPGWLDLVRTVGETFALDVFGVDVIDTGGGRPLIVDINAFPGIRHQPGAPESLAALALRSARPETFSPRQRLIGSLAALAADATVQQAWLTQYDVPTDELALEFDDALSTATWPAADGRRLAEPVMARLGEIGDLLTGMGGPGDADPWTAQALASDGGWQQVRDLSRRLLHELTGRWDHPMPKITVLR
ncbi:RimK family alpha-L-glutamate ligase [Streptomyces sp. NPDC048603]|uniref:ATP-grasp domain-containing protein n=1 Tax=Streptomyces sp. NPDC048603 TaxID=3365577 RepID=UPI00371C0E1E